MDRTKRGTANRAYLELSENRSLNTLNLFVSTIDSKRGKTQ
jgi:hypothetical protein